MVVVSNLVKAVCFLLAIKTAGFKPLVTLGDALASFMTSPDPFTQDLGPLSAVQIRQALTRARIRDASRRISHRIVRRRAYCAAAMDIRSQSESEISSEPAEPGRDHDPLPGLPLELPLWKATRRRWFSGASRLRWFLTYSLYVHQSPFRLHYAYFIPKRRCDAYRLNYVYSYDRCG